VLLALTLQLGDLAPGLFEERGAGEQRAVGQSRGHPDTPIHPTDVATLRNLPERYPAEPDTGPPGARPGVGDGERARLAPADHKPAQLAHRSLAERDVTDSLDIKRRLDRLGRASILAWRTRGDATEMPPGRGVVEDRAKAGPGLEPWIARSLPVLYPPKERSKGLVDAGDGAADRRDTETADSRADLLELFDLVELIEAADGGGPRSVPGDVPGVTTVLEGTVVDVTRKPEQLGEQARPDPGRTQCDLGLADQGGICAVDDQLGRAHA
jgi:hypothetical protein